MNIDITKLNCGLEEAVDINIIYSFSKEELEKTGILELNNLKIEGKIIKSFEDLELSVKISGIMVLPCSLTLKPVNYPFSLEIDEILDDNSQQSSKNIQNTIDIFPIIWENILMEIPLKVVSEDLSDVVTEGDGWKLITEKEEKQNLALEKLKDLL